MSNDIQDEQEEPNPLTFWVAYIPGEGDKKNYLSDGNGHLRVFKTEGALREWLEPKLSPEVYATLVVHSVQGQIAVPADEEQATPPLSTRKPLDLSRLQFPLSTKTPLDLSGITNIHTLAPVTTPSAVEALENYRKRKRIRRK